MAGEHLSGLGWLGCSWPGLAEVLCVLLFLMALQIVASPGNRLWSFSH